MFLPMKKEIPNQKSVKSMASLRESLMTILNSEPDLLCFLEGSQNNMDEFATNLFRLTNTLGLTHEAFVALAEIEIKRRDNESKLFRIDSVPTKFIKLLNQRVGHQYLNCFISSFVFIAQKHLKGRDIFAELETPNHDQAAQTIKDIFHFLLTLLIGTLDMVPSEIRNGCESIHEKVENRFGTGSSRTFLVGYLLVRFICPILAIPESIVTHLELEPNIRRMCVMMSKMLLVAGTGVPFESSSMRFANEIVTDPLVKEVVDLYLWHVCRKEITEQQKGFLQACRSKFQGYESGFENFECVSYFVNYLRKKKEGENLESPSVNQLLNRLQDRRVSFDAILDAISPMALLDPQAQPVGLCRSRSSSPSEKSSPVPLDPQPFIPGDTLPSFPDAMFQLLQSPVTFSALLEVGQHEIDQFTKHFFSSSVACDFVLETLFAIAMHEIKKRENRTQLFRMHQIPTLFFRLFYQKFGNCYIQTLINTFFFSEAASSLATHLDSSSQQQSIIQIKGAVHFMLCVLVSTSNLIPVEIRDSCHKIMKKVTAKFGVVSKRMFLAGYWFGRFICPALATSDHIPLSPAMRRAGVFISKVLLTLATGETFENEAMKFANEVVIDPTSRDYMELFLNEVDDEPLSDEKKEMQIKIHKQYQNYIRNVESDHSISHFDSGMYMVRFLQKNKSTIREIVLQQEKKGEQPDKILSELMLALSEFQGQAHHTDDERDFTYTSTVSEDIFEDRRPLRNELGLVQNVLSSPAHFLHGVIFINNDSEHSFFDIKVRKKSLRDGSKNFNLKLFTSDLPPVLCEPATIFIVRIFLERMNSVKKEETSQCLTELQFHGALLRSPEAKRSANFVTITHEFSEWHFKVFSEKKKKEKKKDKKEEVFLLYYLATFIPHNRIKKIAHLL